MNGPGRWAALVFLLPVLTALLAAVPAGALDVPGSGGVEINGTLLPAEKIWAEYRYNHTLRAMLHEKGGAVDTAMLKRSVKYSIHVAVLTGEAARRGYELTGEDRDLLRAKLVTAWKGEENMKTALAMMGVTEEFILGRNGGEYLIGKMAIGESGAEKGIDEGTLRAFYDENTGKFTPRQGPLLRYVFLPRDEPGLKVNRDLIRDRIYIPAEGLREAGKTYAAIVEEFSRYGGGVVDETAGGSAGLPSLEVGKKLKPCRIARTVPDDAGWYVYLRDCEVPESFENSRKEVREEIIRERREAFIKDLVDDLKEKADLKYLAIDPERIPALATAGAGH